MQLKTTSDIMSYLIAKDSVFERLNKHFGLLKHSLSNDLFESIIYTITGQMLSKNVHLKIYGRLLDLMGGTLQPKKLLKLSDVQMRNCGMAYSKVRYIKEFTANYLQGKYDFSQLKDFSDEEVVKYLRQIKGVGLWTAEMLALFSLGRENIFSYDDVALRNGIKKAKKLKSLSKQRFEQLRKRYSPYCSYASLYFYRSNDDPSFTAD